MAKELLIQSESDSQTSAATAEDIELDITFGIPIKERPIWVDLYESIRDAFFPPKYPPLELTSTPIPVPDRMAVKRNPLAWGIATTINVTILLVALFFVGKHYIEKAKPALNLTDIDVGEFTGPKAPDKAGGGGGGGDHSIVDASKGKLPKIEKNPITPPQVQKLDNPKLPVDAAINVQQDIKIPDNPMLPNLGIKNSVNVQLASNGQGSSGGMGTGSGGGLGSGNGNGYGPGTGGNIGGGLYHVGGGISAPVQLNDVVGRVLRRGAAGQVSRGLHRADYRRRAGKSAEPAGGARPRHGVGRKSPGSCDEIQVQAGHEGRQDPSSRSGQCRDQLPALLMA